MTTQLRCVVDATATDEDYLSDRGKFSTAAAKVAARQPSASSHQVNRERSTS